MRAVQAIDPEVWAALVALENAGEPGFLAALVREFLDTAGPRLDRLRAANARGDASAVEWEAHSLKGSCGSLGASGMVRLCEQLEHAGTAGSGDAARGTLDALDAEWRRVREALAAELLRRTSEAGPKANGSG